MWEEIAAFETYTRKKDKDRRRNTVVFDGIDPQIRFARA